MCYEATRAYLFVCCGLRGLVMLPTNGVRSRPVPEDRRRNEEQYAREPSTKPAPLVASMKYPSVELVNLVVVPLLIFLLPDDVLVVLLSYLDAKSLSRVTATCLFFSRNSVNPVIDVLRRRAANGGAIYPHCSVRGLYARASFLARLEIRRSEAWVPVATDWFSCIFVGDGGRLYSCGSESVGQRGILGLGELDEDNCDRLAPTLLPSMVGIRVNSVATGCGFCVAVSSSGKVYTWGNGSYGCLGHGDTNGSFVPKEVLCFAGNRVLSVAAGNFHCLAVTEEGDVFSWGHAQHGRCGYYVPSYGEHGLRPIQAHPQCIEALTSVRARCVSAFGDHSLVVTESGTVYSFGCGPHGICGSARNGYDDERRPMCVDALCNMHIAAAVTAGRHAIALAANGTVFSWGCNEHGQLGNGRTCVGEPLPTIVDALRGVPVCSIAAGVAASYAVSSAGELYTWGNGESGQLGHCDCDNRCVPTRVDAFRGSCVVAVSTGHISSAAAATDKGKVFFWGVARGFGYPDNPVYNMHGELCSTEPCVYRRLTCRHD